MFPILDLLRAGPPRWGIGINRGNNFAGMAVLCAIVTHHNVAGRPSQLPPFCELSGVVSFGSSGADVVR